MHNYLEELKKYKIPYVPLEPYINMKTKILHECPNGHTWSVKPTHIIHSRSGCPECAKNKKVTTEEHRKEVFPFTFEGEYKNRRSKLTYSCTEGHSWTTTPHSIVTGKTGCPICAGSYKLTTKEYQDRLKSNITLLESYINSSTPILHKCNKCEYEWKASPSNVMAGTGCPLCGGTLRKTDEAYKKEVDSLGFIVQGTYINNKTPLMHICKAKGHKIYTTPSNLLTRKSCSFCTETGPGTLYYLKFQNDSTSYYKIGITKKSVENRIKSLLVDPTYSVTILKEIRYESIQEARQVEQETLRKFKDYRVTVDFVQNGSTEFFNANIWEYLNART